MGYSSKSNDGKCNKEIRWCIEISPSKTKNIKCDAVQNQRKENVTQKFDGALKYVVQNQRRDNVTQKLGGAQKYIVQNQRTENVTQK